MRNIREINEIRVLKAVRENAPISRATLARMLGLSRAAMSGIVQRLMQLGLLVEIGKGQSTARGGRKEILLALNAEAAVLLAADIDVGEVHLGLLDLEANFMREHTFQYAVDESPEQVLEELVRAFRRMLRSAGVKRSSVLGLGLAIPGIIDYNRGVLSEAYALKHWPGFPIREYLEKKLQVPVFLENDVKALAIGEYHFGDGFNVENLVTLWIGEGIGAGIILEGQLIRGASSSAGEVGFNAVATPSHMDTEIRSLLLPDQTPLTWSDVLTHENLRRATQLAIEKGWLTSTNGTSDPLKILVKRANDGDDLAQRILKGFGQFAGLVCTDLIHTLNPQLITLSGRIFSETQVVYEALKKQVMRDTLRSPVEAVSIQPSQLGPAGMLKGAAGLIVSDLFNVPNTRHSGKVQRKLLT